MKQNSIPAFPANAKEVKPLPPKYLEITNADGTTQTIENPKRIEAEKARYGGGAKGSAAVNPVAPKHLTVIQKGGKSPFVKTHMAQNAPVKTFDSAPHRFKAAVDSRSEAKGVMGNTHKLQEQLMNADYSHIHQSAGPRYSGGGMTGPGGVALGHVEAMAGDDRSVGMHSANSRLPKEFGTHYLDVPNAPARLPQALPKHAALPRPYVPHAKHFYDGQQKLANRMANGEILGSYRKNYVDQVNIPAMEEDYVVTAQAGEDEWPVGPDNPVKPYDESGIWSACWDEEAEAVYYYNNENGEATWIPPPL